VFIPQAAAAREISDRRPLQTEASTSKPVFTKERFFNIAGEPYLKLKGMVIAARAAAISTPKIRTDIYQPPRLIRA
jgi:hypothetical protein